MSLIIPCHVHRESDSRVLWCGLATSSDTNHIVKMLIRNSLSHRSVVTLTSSVCCFQLHFADTINCPAIAHMTCSVLHVTRPSHVHQLCRETASICTEKNPICRRPFFLPAFSRHPLPPHQSQKTLPIHTRFHMPLSSPRLN